MQFKDELYSTVSVPYNVYNSFLGFIPPSVYYYSLLHFIRNYLRFNQMVFCHLHFNHIFWLVKCSTYPQTQYTVSYMYTNSGTWLACCKTQMLPALTFTNDKNGQMPVRPSSLSKSNPYEFLPRTGTIYCCKYCFQIWHKFQRREKR